MTERSGRLRRVRWDLILLFSWVLFQGWLLYPETRAVHANLNDHVLHELIVVRMAEAFENRENPLDHWVSEVSLGYPILRTYQPLGHLLPVLAYFALFRQVEVLVVFQWFHYLLLVSLPITVFICARKLHFPAPSALFSGIVSSLLVSPTPYGLEYGSYVWRGSGVFTQSLAAHFLALSIGWGFQAVRTGKSLGRTGVLVGLTLLSHLIYGYIAALSILLLAILPNQGQARLSRIARTAVIGTLSFGITAFQLIPLLGDTELVNHSQWESSWKWDSFGLVEVLRQVLSGQLLDNGRLPVVSLLVVLGVWTAFHFGFRRRNENPSFFGQEVRAAFRFILSGWIFWLLLFAGRPTWGVLLKFLGVSDGMHLHRLIGAVHFFSILLAGIGVAGIHAWLSRYLKDRSWKLTSSPRSQWSLVSLVVLLVLVPALVERVGFLQANTEMMSTTLTSLAEKSKTTRDLVASAESGKGRSYAGLAAGWGKKFVVGETHFYDTLVQHRIPAVSFLYHSMSAASDSMVLFNESRLRHYPLFNVGTVISDRPLNLPASVQFAGRKGDYNVWHQSNTGYFEFVDVPYSAACNRRRFQQLNRDWMAGSWPEKRLHLGLDLGGSFPASVAPRGFTESWEEFDAPTGLGEVMEEWRQGETYGARVRAFRKGFVLFKMSYHSRWSVKVDGLRQKTYMVTPGFQAFPVEAGVHRIELTYRPEFWKSALLIIALVLGVCSFLPKGQVFPAQLVNQCELFWARARSLLQRVLRGQFWWILALCLIVLPVVIPLATPELPGGHDAFEYVPRLVEFHESIRSGNLFPRWAPDLSRGIGQPFFIFNPPLIYYLAEIPYLAGFSAPASLNLVCMAIVLASALGAFFLARFLWGPAEGLVAATAYVYSPYFLTNLYVRHALAEFLAFAFYPLILYGFSRYAKHRQGRHLLLGVLCYAALIWSHFPVALLFSPALVAYLIFEAWRVSDWRLLLHSLAGLLLGLGIAAAVWVPAKFEMTWTHLERLREGALLYTNHFVHLPQLLVTSWGFGLSVPGSGDGMDFSLGYVHLILLAVSCGMMWRGHIVKWKHDWVFWVSSVAALCWLMHPASLVVWDRLPLLQYIQFPWRILSIVIVCIALLCALSVRCLGESFQRSRLVTALAIAAFVLAGGVHSGAAVYHVVEDWAWTPEQIAQRGVRVTTRAEYESRWVEQVPRVPRTPLRVVAGDARVTILERSPHYWEAEVTAGEDTRIEAYLAYFPGWRILVNGEEQKFEIVLRTGLLRFSVPPGNHRVEVEFGQTPLRRAAVALSIVCLLLAPWMVRRMSKAGRQTEVRP